VSAFALRDDFLGRPPYGVQWQPRRTSLACPLAHGACQHRSRASWIAALAFRTRVLIARAVALAFMVCLKRYVIAGGVIGAQTSQGFP
jgi:hypothetical protein